MESLFQGCKNLKTLDLESFDTSNVKDFRYMFSECHLLEKINKLEKLKSSKCLEMEQMFFDCHKLKYIELKSFDFKSAKNTSKMFCGCTELVKLTIPCNFTQTCVTNDMFDDQYNYNNRGKIQVVLQGSDKYRKLNIPEGFNVL